MLHELVIVVPSSSVLYINNSVKGVTAMSRLLGVVKAIDASAEDSREQELMD